MFFTPWERADFLNLPLAFFKTAWSIITRPIPFFSTHGMGRTLSRPLLFGSICYVFGAFISSVWNFVFLTRFDETMNELAVSTEVSRDAIVPIFFSTIPFVALLSFALHWLLFHFAVRIAGEQAPLHVTGRIVSYAAVAYLFQIVPPIAEVPVGPFFSVMWLIHLETTAVRLLFNLSIWRAMAVVMIPFFATLPLMA